MLNSNPPVFRFAPSPNGFLHLGHASSALLNADMAQRTGGRFLLRIEDIDAGRCRPEFEAAIFRDLQWLGLIWEQPVRRQSEHMDDYAAALRTLIDRDLAYPAFLSRSEIRAYWQGRNEAAAPRDPDGALLYPGEERSWGKDRRRRLMEAGAPHAWRLDMERAMEQAGAALTWRELESEAGDEVREIAVSPGEWGDVVLAGRDTPTSYHLSVVVDDCLQGITHVVRGKDLYAATAVHRLLQDLLGYPAPVYLHHDLVLDGTGRKLSKRHADQGIASLRDSGHTPQDIRRLAGL